MEQIDLSMKKLKFLDFLYPRSKGNCRFLRQRKYKEAPLHFSPFSISQYKYMKPFEGEENLS